MRLPLIHYGRGLLTTALLICLAGYFIFHAIEGAYGLRARVILKQKLSALEVEFKALSVRRKKLEHKISLMQSEKLDPDMLDEQARRLLNMAHPDDIVILRQVSPR
ncbi:MAG: septum formation initiator family protein [Pseudomonadota bacterium]